MLRMTQGGPCPPCEPRNPDKQQERTLRATEPAQRPFAGMARSYGVRDRALRMRHAVVYSSHR